MPDWNVDTIALYEAVGGREQNEWIIYRVSGRRSQNSLSFDRGYSSYWPGRQPQS